MTQATILPGDIFELDKQTYRAYRATDERCLGCAGRNSKPLCRKLPFCAPDSIQLVFEPITNSQLAMLKGKGHELKSL